MILEGGTTWTQGDSFYLFNKHLVSIRYEQTRYWEF